MKTIAMNKATLLVTCSLFSLGLFSCSKKSDSPATTASVMVVNGCTGTSTTGTNAAAGGVAINSASNLAFLRSSGYQNVTAGSDVPFTFTLNGVGALTSGTQSLTIGQHYSVFAGGSVTHPTFLSTSDDLTAVAGMAKIRFVNLSTDGLSEKCFVGNVAVDSNITANQITSFSAVTPGSVTIIMQDPSLPATSLVQLTGVSLSAGNAYTVMLTGTSAGAGAPGLAATVIQN